MPDQNRGMVNTFRLPTTMREYADVRFDLKQTFLVNGLVATTSRPGVCGQRLRVTAAKQSMRLKSLRLESSAHPRQKFTGGVFGDLVQRLFSAALPPPSAVRLGLTGKFNFRI